MKFTVDRDRFAEAVSWVGKASDSRHSTQPILAGMLIDADADSGAISLSAFDYEMSSQAVIPAVVLEPGDMLVSAELLAKVAATADGGEITVMVGDSSATLTCEGDRWDLALMPSYDYPSLPQPGEPVGWVNTDELARAVKQINPIVGRGKGAEIGHQGIFFDVAGDMLALAATDRVRLAATEIAWQQGDGESYSAIVPPRLLEFVGQAKGDVGVSFTRGHDDKVTLVTLSSEGRVSTCRVIDAQFPNWRGFFARLDEAIASTRGGDASSFAVVTVETAVLKSAMKKAGTIMEDVPSRPAKLWMHVKPGDGLELSGGDLASGLGQFASQVQADVTGAPLPMLFRMGLLSGIVNVIETDSVQMTIIGKLRPVLFRPVSESSRYRVILQPLKDMTGATPEPGQSAK